MIETIAKIYQASEEGKWTSLAEIKTRTGISQEELTAAVKWMMAEIEDVRIEPQPFNWKISEADKAAAVIIGGEPRHLIKFGI